MTDLSARLRTHGLTLSDFRRWIGMSQRQVEAWSRGEAPTPQHVTVLLDLADDCQVVPIPAARPLAGRRGPAAL